MRHIRQALALDLAQTLAVLSLSALADEHAVLHSFTEISHPSEAQVDARASFTVEGNVHFVRQSGNVIGIEDNGKTVGVRSPENVAASSFLGCRVRILGHLVPFDRGIATAQATNVEALARCEVPPPIETDAATFLSGVLDGKVVMVKGIISDIRKDDVDPEWTLVTLVSEGRAICCNCLDDLRADLLTYLGAEVSVTGQCSMPYHAHRRFLGPSIFVSDKSAFRLIRPPSDDPFAAARLEDVTNVTPQSVVTLGRRSSSGRVLATWGQSHLLLRTGAGDVCQVHLAEQPLPNADAVIDVSGFPDTDLYHLNLSHAAWRRSQAEMAASETEPAAMTAEEILTNDRGQKRILYRFHGRLIRLTGEVVSLPAAGNNNGILSIRNGKFLVPIDISSTPAALDDVTVGCRLAVTGVCRIDIINPSPAELVPGIDGFTLIVRKSGDIRILSRPPWWTPGRLLLVLGILVATLCGILVWNLILRRLAERRGQKLAEALLAKTKANLRVGERTRLAVELHDTLVQNMTGVAIALRTRNYDLAAKTLDFCRRDLRNCLWDLRNLTLDDEDINAAIRKTLAPHAAGVRLQVRFSVPREKFTDNTAHAILCILRELTINAVRHGGATAIWVAGSVEGDHLLFSVKDNGCGFDPAAAPGMEQGHFGLQGIRDRVEGFEGNMTVESTPGNGSKATISLNMSHLDNVQKT